MRKENMPQIKLFTSNLNDFLNPNYIKTKNKLEEILDLFYLSFSIENISRFTSFIIEENKDTYVKQSIPKSIINNSFYIPKVFQKKSLKNELSKYCELNNKLINLYNEITSNEEAYNIKKDDAEYILPLSIKTNLFVTMSAGKLIKLFERLFETEEGRKIIFMLKDRLPDNKKEIINYTELGNHCYYCDTLFNNKINKLKNDNRVILYDITSSPTIRIGLATLTKDKTLPASSNINIYSIEKLKKIAYKNIKTNSNITKHIRFSLGAKMSLKIYNEFLRYKNIKYVREDFYNIKNNEIILPKSIEENKKIKKKFLGIYEQILEYKEKTIKKLENKIFPYLLLNCNSIKIISNQNLLDFSHFSRKNLCYQKPRELRELTKEIYDLLVKYIDKRLFYKPAPLCIYNLCENNCKNYSKALKEYSYMK